MRLGEFIARDSELIQQRWEAFATTRAPAADHMSSRSLRDNLPEILHAIVADLATPQTVDAQTAKSMGLAPIAAGAPHTAAQTHAVLRAESGFDIEQLASEYRALPASVNAVNYGEPGEAIRVALRGSAKDVCLTVENAGETIDSETLAHLFEPLRRGNGRAAKHDSGLGLGLFIASEITKAHGGVIAADSKGHKTAFSVNLPKPVLAPRPTARSAAPGRGPTIFGTEATNIFGSASPDVSASASVLHSTTASPTAHFA